MNLLEKYNQEYIEKITAGKAMPAFNPGDQVKVFVKITDGATERIQVFEGTCFARKNRGISSSFLVKKLSDGEGVERVFQLYSPRIDKLEVVRRGRVRRAKLYYMRALQGKAARIKEKVTPHAKMKKAK